MLRKLRGTCFIWERNYTSIMYIFMLLRLDVVRFPGSCYLLGTFYTIFWHVAYLRYVYNILNTSVDCQWECQLYKSLKLLKLLWSMISLSEVFKRKSFKILSIFKIYHIPTQRNLSLHKKFVFQYYLSAQQHTSLSLPYNFLGISVRCNKVDSSVGLAEYARRVSPLALVPRDEATAATPADSLLWSSTP